MQHKPHNQFKIRALIKEGEYILASGPHVERASLDAEALMLHILQRDARERNHAWLIAHRNSHVMPPTRKEFEALVARRLAGMPMQYITGSAEFFGLPFLVAPGVLIPRPETEHLVEEVIRVADAFTEPHIADIGTGSGAIAVALAHSLGHAQVSAVDLSPQALAIAQQNAVRNDVENQIEFFEGDLLAPLVGQSFHIIASNPPYVPLLDRDSLSVEVRDHEPHSALFAGDDGLSIYRRLIPEARALLVPEGWLVMEIGYGQREAVDEMLMAHGYRGIRFVPDYQGIPRVAVGQKADSLRE